MQAYIDSQKAELRSLKISGWHPTLSPLGLGEGSSGFTPSMADTAAIANCQKYMYKRRRLSRLLNKLTVQINNNQYRAPNWPMVDAANKNSKATEDVPLDLSLKSETPKANEGAPKTFVCNICGQTFDIADRLTKHIASRHKERAPDASRAYECGVCRRRFARSDMLTRHARLHSGVKPYSCSICGQVFSRSDHLATHQRTHTGEKPYRCPACPYAACRRDMITRHMRTHTRKQQTPEL